MSSTPRASFGMCSYVAALSTKQSRCSSAKRKSGEREIAGPRPSLTLPAQDFSGLSRSSFSYLITGKMMTTVLIFIRIKADL
jgi:hypothetical protein